MKSHSSIRKSLVISNWSRRASVFFLGLILGSACCWNDFSTDVGEYGGEDWSFVVVGDSRSGGGIYSNLTSWMTQIRPMPVFAMHLGDMNPFRETSSSGRTLSGCRSPDALNGIYCTPGNHDVDDETSQAIYRSHFSLPGNELYYSFFMITSNSSFLIQNIPARLKESMTRRRPGSRPSSPRSIRHPHRCIHSPARVLRLRRCSRKCGRTAFDSPAV